MRDQHPDGLSFAEKVVGCGNTSVRKTGKIKVFGLTQSPALCIKAPLIDEFVTLISRKDP